MLRNEVEFGQEIKYLHNLYHLRGRQKSNLEDVAYLQQ